MTAPPKILGGATLVRWSLVDARHRPTGNAQQVVAGTLRGPAAGLAICQAEGEDAYYLFGCDERWKTVTDTWHETLEEALQQAEFEYEGVSATWNIVK